MLYAEHKCHRLSQKSKEWKSEKLDAKDVLPNINYTQATKRPKNVVFVPGDLYLQTRLSEKPNMSSV